MARGLPHRLASTLGQSVIVDAKAGGSATIGTDFVARAGPDGPMLLLDTSDGHVVTPPMQRIPSDGIADFMSSAWSPANPTCWWASGPGRRHAAGADRADRAGRQGTRQAEPRLRRHTGGAAPALEDLPGVVDLLER
ncbi:MAG TPA: tripartite tricarboxylate transporter substrate-binding protein [Variovorax sp.]|nr:tripartite tricarboxylate transporter substrate-binding protein [Variovorax sp.]